jgi:hypothetical protein
VDVTGKVICDTVVASRIYIKAAGLVFALWTALLGFRPFPLLFQGQREASPAFFFLPVAPVSLLAASLSKREPLPASTHPLVFPFYSLVSFLFTLFLS